MKSFVNCTIEQKIERWENALRVLTDMPTHVRHKHWDMSTWGYQNECGTIACAAGHCGLDSWFHEQGFKLKFITYIEKGKQCTEGIISSSYDFFGANGARHIFYNNTMRSVDTVIKEINAYIRHLKTFGYEVNWYGMNS